MTDIQVPVTGDSDRPPHPTEVGLQTALAIVAARTYRQPDSYQGYRPSDAELNELVAGLREKDATANYPVRCYVGSYDGDDWLVGFGNVDRDGEHGNVTITTDRVHCSEMRGDALDDAEAYVYVRNALPRIIAALEELLALRVKP